MKKKEDKESEVLKVDWGRYRMDVRCEKIRDTFLQFAVKYAEQAQIDFAMTYALQKMYTVTQKGN